MRHAVTFARRNWIVLGLLLASIAIAFWFALSLVSDALYFNDPRNLDVDLKPWMTPRYVVHTYDLPRSLVMEVLELDPEADRGIRLGRLAEDRGMSMDDLTALVRDAADTFRGAEQ
ncbi:MAG: hypothetical protein AAFR93_08700 [Pseudomonadota bacterium]